MPISENAKQVIAQTIARTAYSIPVSFPEGGITKMMDAIEQELEEAGLVILRRDDLTAIGWNEREDRRSSDS